MSKVKMTGLSATWICLFAQTISAFAEKIDLVCPTWEKHSAYLFAIDPEAMMVTDMDGAHKAEIKDDWVIWFDAHNYGRYYNLQSSILMVIDYPSGLQLRWNGCVRATKAPE
jgi:hypothetical protein